MNRMTCIAPNTRFGNTASLFGAVAIGLALLPGCASSPPAPGARMVVAEAAVQRASTASTGETAAVELRLANAKLASAHAALASKDYTRSEQLAEQAEADAQFAELHARAERARKAAQESQEAARVLREEIARKTPR